MPFVVSVWAATQKKKRGCDSTTYVNLLPICCIRSAAQWKCICWRWNAMHVNSTWDKRTVLQRPRGLSLLVTDNVTGMLQRRTRGLTVPTWFHSPLSAAAFLQSLGHYRNVSRNNGNDLQQSAVGSDMRLDEMKWTDHNKQNILCLFICLGWSLANGAFLSLFSLVQKGATVGLEQVKTAVFWFILFWFFFLFSTFLLPKHVFKKDYNFGVYSLQLFKFLALVEKPVKGKTISAHI